MDTLIEFIDAGSGTFAALEDMETYQVQVIAHTKSGLRREVLLDGQAAIETISLTVNEDPDSQESNIL